MMTIPSLTLTSFQKDHMHQYLALSTKVGAVFNNDKWLQLSAVVQSSQLTVALSPLTANPSSAYAAVSSLSRVGMVCCSCMSQEQPNVCIVASLSSVNSVQQAAAASQATTSAASRDGDSGTGSLSAGAKAGIGIGAVVGVILVIIVILLFRRFKLGLTVRQRSPRSPKEKSKKDPPAYLDAKSELQAEQARFELGGSAPISELDGRARPQELVA